MYLIELNDNDLESIISDSEYFTASEDEYFSAEEGDAISRHRYSPAPGKYSSPASSRSSPPASSRASTPSYQKSLKHHSDPAVTTMAGPRWQVDDSDPRGKYRLNKHTYVAPSLMKNYYLWRRLIRAGNHPRDAATIIGSQFCYKQVKQKKGIQVFSIRLSQEQRVYFMIQEKERIVKILNIGTHEFG